MEIPKSKYTVRENTFGRANQSTEWPGSNE